MRATDECRLHVDCEHPRSRAATARLDFRRPCDACRASRRDVRFGDSRASGEGSSPFPGTLAWTASRAPVATATTTLGAAPTATEIASTAHPVKSARLPRPEARSLDRCPSTLEPPCEDPSLEPAPARCLAATLRRPTSPSGNRLPGSSKPPFTRTWLARASLGLRRLRSTSATRRDVDAPIERPVPRARLARRSPCPPVSALPPPRAPPLGVAALQARGCATPLAGRRAGRALRVEVAAACAGARTPARRAADTRRHRPERARLRGPRRRVPVEGSPFLALPAKGARLRANRGAFRRENQGGSRIAPLPVLVDLFDAPFGVRRESAPLLPGDSPPPSRVDFGLQARRGWALVSAPSAPQRSVQLVLRPACSA